MRQAEIFGRQMAVIGRGVGKVALGGAAVAAGALAIGIRKSMMEASKLQTAQTGFEVILKGATAAKERVQELAKFAAATPFEFSGIAEASRILEVFAGRTLSTGKGLTLVGDAAAAANTPIEELSLHVGRLYDGLMTGRPVGEAMARLQELGLISGQTRTQIELLQKSGASGAQVWKVAEQALSRFSGSMARQSATWAGKMSTLRDNINLTFAAFGQPLIDVATPFLDGLIGRMDKLQAMAPFVAKSLSADIADIFRSRDIATSMADLGGRFVSVMSAAGVAAAKVLAGSLLNGFAGPIAELQSRMQVIVGMFSGKRPMTAEEMGERADLGRKIAKDEEALKTAPASTSGFSTAGGFAFGDSSENSREAIQYRLTQNRQRKAALDQRAAEAALLDKDAIKEDILASGGPEVWMGGDPMKSADFMKSAFGSISEAAKSNLPNTARSLRTLPSVFGGAWGGSAAKPQNFGPTPATPFPAPGMMSSGAESMIGTMGEGEEGPAPGSRAGAWESHLRRTRSTLPIQGLKLGAVRTAADIASTSKGIWRGSNKPSPSKQWSTADGSQKAAMRAQSSMGSSGKGSVHELLQSYDKRLEKIAVDVERLATGG